MIFSVNNLKIQSIFLAFVFWVSGSFAMTQHDFDRAQEARQREEERLKGQQDNANNAPSIGQILGGLAQNAPATAALPEQLSPNKLTPVRKKKTEIKTRFFRMVAGTDTGAEDLGELASAEKTQSPQSTISRMLKAIEENLLDSLQEQGVDTSKISELAQLEKDKLQLLHARLSYPLASCPEIQEYIDYAAKLINRNSLKGFLDTRTTNEKTDFAATNCVAIFCNKEGLSTFAEFEPITFIMAHELIHAKYLDPHIRTVVKQLLPKNQQGAITLESQHLLDNLYRFQELRADAEAAVAHPILTRGYILFSKKLGEKFGSGRHAVHPSNASRADLSQNIYELLHLLQERKKLAEQNNQAKSLQTRQHKVKRKLNYDEEEAPVTQTVQPAAASSSSSASQQAPAYNGEDFEQKDVVDEEISILQRKKPKN